MKPKRKTITPEMIRQCFGPGAEISKFLGRYRVRTRDGGEVKIWQREIKPVRTSREAYAGCTRLVGEAWDGGKLKGPPDFLLAMLAHGENEGVNLRVKERGLVGRTIVAALIGFIGIDLSSPGVWPFVWLVVSLAVWLLLGHGAKRRAEHETEQMSFPYPRTGGDAHEASDEDLKKGGWL